MRRAIRWGYGGLEIIDHRLDPKKLSRAEYPGILVQTGKQAPRAASRNRIQLGTYAPGKKKGTTQEFDIFLSHESRKKILPIRGEGREGVCSAEKGERPCQRTETRPKFSFEKKTESDQHPESKRLYLP